jgi:hypothetical protein
MKINLQLIFLDILFIGLFAYGIYRYVYEVSNRVLVLRLSLLLFAYVGYEHYKIYKNRVKSNS